jgi:hypothetical protein
LFTPSSRHIPLPEWPGRFFPGDLAEQQPGKNFPAKKIHFGKYPQVLFCRSGNDWQGRMDQPVVQGFPFQRPPPADVR